MRTFTIRCHYTAARIPTVLPKVQRSSILIPQSFRGSTKAESTPLLHSALARSTPSVPVLKAITMLSVHAVKVLRAREDLLYRVENFKNRLSVQHLGFIDGRNVTRPLRSIVCLCVEIKYQRKQKFNPWLGWTHIPRRTQSN